MAQPLSEEEKQQQVCAARRLRIAILSSCKLNCRAIIHLFHPSFSRYLSASFSWMKPTLRE